MNKKCVSAIVVLLLVIAAGVYTFVFQGSVSPGDDGRTVIHLDAGERDLVLAEMRAFLVSVQQITQGVSDDDMSPVVEAARRVGRAAQGEVPGTLMGKLPVEFKQLGFDTHSKFDQLALDAEDLGDPAETLSQLATLMQNCVACHAAYRFEVAPGS